MDSRRVDREVAVGRSNSIMEDTLKRASMLMGSFVALLLTAGTSHSRPVDGLEGNWEGFMAVSPTSEVRVVFRVEKDAKGNLTARSDSPEFKARGTTVFEEVSSKGRDVSFKSKASGREFAGKLNPAGTEIVGEWKKGANSLPLTVVKLDGPVTPSDVWEGALDLGAGRKLKLAFHVLKTKAGEFKAGMDSPDQGVFGMKVTTTEVGKDSLKFVIKGVGEYEGTVGLDGKSSAGQWKQNGASLPLVLNRVAEVSETLRPQNPKGPFPYVSEEVAYDSRAKGVRIAGTLTLPEGNGPFPVVLLITGSGAQDRDETILGHKPFLVLADDLARRGIAALRVDDRGINGSSGDPITATTADFVEDVLGGVDFLKSHKRVNPKRIGLMGHSEGGLIAPIVATKSKDVAFIVLLAGTGVPGDRILQAQAALILKASGADEATIRRTTEAQAKLVAIVKATQDPKLVVERLKLANDDLMKSYPEAERKALLEADPNGGRVAMLAAPWFRYFLTFDPRPTLAKVRCPVLAINGEKDLQVPCKENLGEIEKALRSGGNTRFTIKEMPGLNHLFQHCTTGAPSEYGSIETTFDPAALKVVGDWIVDQTRAK